MLSVCSTPNTCWVAFVSLDISSDAQEDNIYTLHKRSGEKNIQQEVDK